MLAYDVAHAAAAAATARVLLDYGAKGDLEAAITCAFAADIVHDLLGRVIGREQLWNADSARPRPRPPGVVRLSRPRVPRRPRRVTRATPPRRRHGDGPGHVSRLRRQRRRPARRARPSHERRRPRGRHHRPRRARGLRAVRPGGVRRLLRGRRQRVPRDGHRHRGAQPGEPGYRRVVDHPAGDPHPGPRQGRHRGAEAALAAAAGRAPR